MTHAEKAGTFAALHISGDPLVLYNAWDAGSAGAVAEAGAKAIATASWSVAAAHGYADGEAIPLDLLLAIVARITATVDLPVTVDFEGGYAASPDAVAENVGRVIDAGAIGINFEDRVVGGEGLHPVGLQADRIRAIRLRVGDRPLFINARTDLFLQEQDRGRHAGVLPAAIDRAAAYAEAGASGFFVPGLVESDLIGRVCEACPLPVNVMQLRDAPPRPALASLGVARISHGPGAYRAVIAELVDRARQVLGDG